MFHNGLSQLSTLHPHSFAMVIEMMIVRDCRYICEYGPSSKKSEMARKMMREEAEIDETKTTDVKEELRRWYSDTRLDHECRALASHLTALLKVCHQ